MSITFCLGIIGFQNFCYSIVFILWLEVFANQHTKSIEKHKHFGLIAPKQMKIDMPCNNKKSLNSGAFSDTSVSFSHKDKKVFHFRVCLQIVDIAIKKAPSNIFIVRFETCIPGVKILEFAFKRKTVKFIRIHRVRTFFLGGGGGVSIFRPLKTFAFAMIIMFLAFLRWG